jgi:hypothetical protein
MIDRSVFLLGWRTGSLLRGLRNKVPEVPEEPDVPDQRYDVTFEDGILYIRKAPAVMVYGDELSLMAWDIENEEE